MYSLFICMKNVDFEMYEKMLVFKWNFGLRKLIYDAYYRGHVKMTEYFMRRWQNIRNKQINKIMWRWLNISCDDEKQISKKIM